MDEDHIPQNTPYTVLGIVAMGIVLAVVAGMVKVGLLSATIGLLY